MQQAKSGRRVGAERAKSRRRTGAGEDATPNRVRNVLIGDQFTLDTLQMKQKRKFVS